MVAPAFGFSVGDFIAAIELIAKVAKALRETDGATAKYQQAALELDSLVSILRRVQALQTTGSDSNTLQQIQLCSLTCHIPLARFIHKIQSLEADLGYCSGHAFSKHAARRLIRIGRKVEWALSLETEHRRLKAEIGPQLHAIQLLLQLESLARVDRIQQTSETAQREALNLLTSVSDLNRYIRSDVATWDKIAPLQPLIETFVKQQSHKDDRILDATRVTQGNTEALQSKLEVQEGILNCILDKLATSPGGGPQTLSSTQSTSSMPANIEPGRTTTVSSIGFQQAEFATHLGIWFLAIRSRITELVIMLLCLLPAMQRLMRTLTALSRSPTMLLTDNIHLEDAVGRTMSLPYENFKFWPVLQSRLQEAFSGVPGQYKVKHNQFHIINIRAAANLVLTKKNWERSVFPGSNLAMSMLFTNSTFVRQTCPRCQAIDATASDNEWTKCEDCGLAYRVLERQSTNLPKKSRASIDLDDIMDGVEYVSDLADCEDSVLLDHDSDMTFFRRIHFIGHEITASEISASAYLSLPTPAMQYEVPDTPLTLDPIPAVRWPSLYSRPRATSSRLQAEYGPPPSPSAYQAMAEQQRAAAWAQYYQQQVAYQQAAAAYGPAPPNQAMQYYSQSPLQTSSTLQRYPTASGLQRDNSFSAHMTDPAGTNDDSRIAAQLGRSHFTRLPSTRQTTMPGSFPGGDPESSETELSSEESSSEESENETERARRAYARFNRQALSSLRRRPYIEGSNDTAPIRSPVSQPVDRAELVHSIHQGMLQEHNVRKPSLRQQPLTLPENQDSERDRIESTDDQQRAHVPQGARWTKIDRRLVSPEALDEAGERYKKRPDSVMVLRILSKEEIEKLTDRTRKMSLMGSEEKVLIWREGLARAQY